MLDSKNSKNQTKKQIFSYSYDNIQQIMKNITQFIKFKDNKWERSKDVEPIVWPVDSNLTPTEELINLSITEIEDYFNKTYPTYEVYSLYEKMKEE